jgi:hypothetical protein
VPTGKRGNGASLDLDSRDCEFESHFPDDCLWIGQTSSRVPNEPRKELDSLYLHHAIVADMVLAPD